MILNIPGVIHLFVALLGPFWVFCWVFLFPPRPSWKFWIGGVSEPFNLFPQFLRSERKHPVPGLQAMAVETYSPIEDLDKQVPILVFIKLDFPRVFSEFHLGKRREGALLKCLPDGKRLAEASKPSTSAHQVLTFSSDCLFRRVAAVSEGILSKIRFFSSALENFSPECSDSSTRFQKRCLLSCTSCKINRENEGKILQHLVVMVSGSRDPRTSNCSHTSSKVRGELESSRSLQVLSQVLAGAPSRQSKRAIRN